MMIKTLRSLTIGTAFMLPSSLLAVSLNIDFNNAVANANGQETGSYIFPGNGSTVTAVGNTGPGMSTADGQLYFIDGVWSGHAVRGPYTVADNGVGSIDSIPTGGIASDGLIIANGLPHRAGDANDIYLGLGMSGSSPDPFSAPGQAYNRETAHWTQAIVLESTTTLNFSYQWAPAMGTLQVGGDVFAGMGLTMSSVFYIDTDLNYANGIYGGNEFISAPATYLGAGTQNWITENGTVTLPAGTYYIGFSIHTTGDVSSIPRYITVDGVKVVPEPSVLLCGALGSLTLLRRRRASGRGN